MQIFLILQVEIFLPDDYRSPSKPYEVFLIDLLRFVTSLVIVFESNLWLCLWFATMQIHEGHPGFTTNLFFAIQGHADVKALILVIHSPDAVWMSFILLVFRFLLASVATMRGLWLILLFLQITKCVGGHSPIQALQQAQRVCSDETSTWVSSQTWYVFLNLLTAAAGKSRTDVDLFVPSLADIPVFPTITATVTFQEFRYDDFEESIFSIPSEYKEDPSRFPDLWPVNTNRKWPACWKTNEESCIVLLVCVCVCLYIYIYVGIYRYTFFIYISHQKGNWSYWSVIFHFADRSKANQCKKMLACHLT